MKRKVCVFCGGVPSDKTKEHVVPRWLIELTGDGNRNANFGPVWGRSGANRAFAFDAFHFPACRRCNEQYAQLEDAARVITKRLLNDEPLTGLELSVLLDWLDKVRVGLWLGMSMLDGNIVGIRPKFHIATRIRRYDRSVVFFRCSRELPALTFGGTIGTSFQYSPTSFTLRVGHVLMLNASTISLCAAYMGLPHPTVLVYVNDGASMESDFSPANGIVRERISDVFSVPEGGRQFSQAVFQGWMNHPSAKPYFASSIVEKQCRGMPAGTSSIFLHRKRRSMRPLKAMETTSVLPPEAVANEIALHSSIRAAYETQVRSYLNEASFEQLSAERTAEMKGSIEEAARLNAVLLEQNRRSLIELGYL